MSTYGEALKLNIYGSSHGPLVGMSLEGIPAGQRIDLAELRRFMRRRAPGGSPLASARKEPDEIEFLRGLKGEHTDGGVIEAVIQNRDLRPQDYKDIENCPRPGHADFAARMKFGDSYRFSGGGQFSARLTAPLCIAGGICIQLLRARGISIISRIASIGCIEDEGELSESLDFAPFPTVSETRGREMQELILKAKQEGDSVGGVVECKLINVPAGLGDAGFQGMEGRLACAIFGIPAVKGVEFGAGFSAAKMRGSENNDQFRLREGRIETLTNHCGGILGGITNGMPLELRVAFKPTPSIARPQQSVNMNTMQEEMISVHGRHDPCVVPRALPCVEAAAAVAVYDALLLRDKEISQWS